MMHLKISLGSPVLGKEVHCEIVMPQTTGISPRRAGKDGKFRLLYLLHGLSDDETSWGRFTSVERYAERYDIAVVMPDGGKSFYCDMKHGERYYEHIAHELPAIVSEMFPISTAREDRMIAGLSMGGYGALKIALREPENWSAAASLSPVGDIQDFITSEAAGEYFAHYDRVFGYDRVVPEEDDVLKLAEKNTGLRPSIYLAMGTEDGLYRFCVPVKEKLEALGYDLTYFEGPGVHDWDFWDEQIKRAMEWKFK